MRTVYVIGIGAGDPGHLTLSAIRAMNEVDVFFGIDKGTQKADLAALRTQLVAEHVTRPHRFVDAPDPERDRDLHNSAAGYAEVVADWQARRGELYARMITEELRTAVSAGSSCGVIRRCTTARCAGGGGRRADTGRRGVDPGGSAACRCWRRGTG